MNNVDIADPFARQLMARYLANRHHDLARLRTALSLRDFETVRITGHNLHGSGSAYGLDRISELGREIEDAAERGDGDALNLIVEQMRQFVESLTGSPDNGEQTRRIRA